MSEITSSGDHMIIKPGVDVVASMADEFKQELLSIIDTSRGDIILDFLDVGMVDSVGIGIIIATHNTLEKAARKLKIINVTKDIFGLFSAMRLNKRFLVEAAG